MDELKKRIKGCFNYDKRDHGEFGVGAVIDKNDEKECFMILVGRHLVCIARPDFAAKKILGIDNGTD